MNLKECFQNKKFGSCDKKPVNYFNVYESHFEHLRNESLNMLEIGVRWGGSVWGWRNYFPNANIIGMDVDPNSMQYGNDDPKNGVKLYLGDQCDSKLLNTINTYLNTTKTSGEEGIKVFIENTKHNFIPKKDKKSTLHKLKLINCLLYVKVRIAILYDLLNVGKEKSKEQEQRLKKDIVENKKRVKVPGVLGLFR